jgi:hypothetical protein
LTEITELPSEQNELRILLEVLERGVHKLINLNQVSILTSELLKEKIKTVDNTELIESLVSRITESGELLRGLFKYVEEFKSSNLADIEKKIAQV